MDDGGLSPPSKYKDVLQSLGDREPSSKLEAQAVIGSIRAEKGHVDEETRKNIDLMPDGSRQDVWRIIKRMQDTEAAYTKSISEQLYSSKYRFLYEVIQNADDSRFDVAGYRKLDPFLRFTVRPTEIVMETNEDGFTRANVESICETGKSSKKASSVDDHIGEKGFGFKSVFAVANKVHIQSGLWSFGFEHSFGDNGLGMVTPLEVPFATLPEDVTTRITLKLADTRPPAFEKLTNAVRNLPHTTVFFLQRLKLIRINIENLDGTGNSSIIRRRPSNGKVTLAFVRTEFSGSGVVATQDKTSEYHVFSHRVRTMPRDERRKGRTEAEIKIAFPVNADTQLPELSEQGQHVFAYLPLQRLPQLQFLIQSDFITSASRESVIDCPWNDAICEGAATAFAHAITTFAIPDHPLRHAWVDYLPHKAMEHPWKGLYPKIISLLKDRCVLQSWQSKKFKRPTQLRYLVDLCFHQGEPIVDDLPHPDDLYLARELVSRTHEKILEDLGIQPVSWYDLLNRLGADLMKPNSKMRTTPPADGWHTSCTNLLLAALRLSEAPSITGRVKRLAVIPLVGENRWTGAPGSSPGGLKEIYFPTTDGIPIPTEIGLHLVNAIAASQPSRAELFRKLGVEDCSVQKVIASISKTHRADKVSLNQAKPHYNYLFHFEKNLESMNDWLRIPTVAYTLHRPQDLTFFQSECEYDAQKLLSRLHSGKFVHPDLVQFLPPDERRQNISWINWLERVTRARYYPPLIGEGEGEELSPILDDVLRENPDKFIGMLHAHWAEEYRTIVYAHMTWLPLKLGELEVPCENGIPVPMNSAYLPTESIKAMVRKLGIESFPVLRLPVELDQLNIKDWQFLDIFGVGCKLDLRFYKLALGHMVDLYMADDSDSIASGGSFSFDSVTYKENIIEVYQSIANLATMQDKEELRELFERLSAIYYPHGPRYPWYAPSECVWSGPEFLTVTPPLEQCYFSQKVLGTFFRVFLGIRDSTLDDVILELEHASENNESQVRRAREMYSYLDSNAWRQDNWEAIREAFTEKKLILADGRWHTLSSCLWENPYALSDYVQLSTSYSNLKNFFVERLKLKTVSPSMLVTELAKMAKRERPSFAGIRQKLIDLSMMMAKHGVDKSLSSSLDKLKEVKFLPIKTTDGESALVSIEDDFVNLDHERFGAAFAGHATFLDFSLAESQILDSLLGYMGLRDRYLSLAVTEASVVSGDTAQNQPLTQHLRAKAYALYCCAAKFKSVKAFLHETALYHQVSGLEVLTSDAMSTQMVLQSQAGPVTVQSDRIHIHSEVINNQLRIYLPTNRREQESCYRFQLPDLFLKLLCITSDGAKFPISQILAVQIEDMDAVLHQLDIPAVSWIEKPVPDSRLTLDFGQPTIRRDQDFEDDEVTLLATPPRRGSVVDSDESVPLQIRQTTSYQSPQAARVPHTPEPTNHYERLVDNVIRSAGRSAPRGNDNAFNLSSLQSALQSIEDGEEIFDHVATFGDRNRNQFAHDKKIGAAGEAFVFETLSRRNFPGFGRWSWQSTIRGEVNVHHRYADMGDWRGTETADIVYTDRDGSLTTYLRNHCKGGFPDFTENTNGVFDPIVYYIEVKTTTSTYSTRFFMSNNQYQRMERMKVVEGQRPKDIYVIFRVFDLMTDRRDMHIYVDPWRLRGNLIEFEEHTWVGKPK